MLGVGSHYLAIFGVHGARDHRALLSGHADRHEQGLGGARRAVIHGCIGHIHTGQFTDHGLELEDGLQRSLSDLRLVGRVSSKELSARDQRVDNYRPIMMIGPGAEEHGVAGSVRVRALAKVIYDLGLRHLPRHLQVSIKPVFGGNGRKQIVDRFTADLAQHLRSVGGRFRKIAHSRKLVIE